MAHLKPALTQHWQRVRHRYERFTSVNSFGPHNSSRARSYAQQKENKTGKKRLRSLSEWLSLAVHSGRNANGHVKRCSAALEVREPKIQIPTASHFLPSHRVNFAKCGELSACGGGVLALTCPAGGNRNCCKLLGNTIWQNLLVFDVHTLQNRRPGVHRHALQHCLRGKMF